MIVLGLVSITFRKLSPEQIVELVRKSGLSAIEWGGDVHVPHGDIALAKEVRRMTVDAGLKISAYGSYYRVGHGEPAPFESVLATALALGAPVVRVWAGRQGSAKSDENYWKLVIEDSARIARMAAAEGVTVAYEYHGNTLTDTCDGALRLLESVGAHNLLTYWQPLRGSALSQNLAELEKVLPSLCHLHVYHWEDGKRMPFAKGVDFWTRYLECSLKTGRKHGALLEHVADDDPDNFLEDARELKQLVERLLTA